MATKPVPKMDELVPLKSAFDPNAILESLLTEGNPHYVHPHQHSNIKAAIAMYQSGELNGSKLYIAGGKVVTHEDALKGGIPVWIEGGQYHQFIQKASGHPNSAHFNRKKSQCSPNATTPTPNDHNLNTDIAR